MSWLLFASGIGFSAQCTVDGHGPYPYALERCRDLCLAQAKTNCILKKASGTAIMVFAEKGLDTQITCLSVRERKICGESKVLEPLSGKKVPLVPKDK